MADWCAISAFWAFEVTSPQPKLGILTLSPQVTFWGFPLPPFPGRRLLRMVPKLHYQKMFTYLKPLDYVFYFLQSQKMNIFLLITFSYICNEYLTYVVIHRLTFQILDISSILRKNINIIPCFIVFHRNFRSAIIDCNFFASTNFWNRPNFSCTNFFIPEFLSIWTARMVKPWSLYTNSLLKGVCSINSINIWN